MSGVSDELPKERVWIEFEKLMLISIKPLKGFKFLNNIGLVDRYYSELNSDIESFDYRLKSLDKMAEILRESRFDKKEIKEYMILNCIEIIKKRRS